MYRGIRAPPPPSSRPSLIIVTFAEIVKITEEEDQPAGVFTAGEARASPFPCVPFVPFVQRASVHPELSESFGDWGFSKA
uniref:Uncharacterized protein n=1 Tax=Oryza punctata TaxID=4537 RepID=A0A0E0K2U8_ORYPU